MNSGAIFDSSGAYRYLLWREWDDHARRIGVVMLNPSRADSVVNDPTIRRCLGFARTWGYGGLEVMNLFAYRSSNPIALTQVVDPVGVENDEYLVALTERVDDILLAWGNWGRLSDRNRSVLQLFSNRTDLYCLGKTKSGQPCHPLYLPKTSLPMRWENS
jgi:hypothetical protein